MINVYPNPSNNLIYIGSTLKMVSVTLFNMSGKLNDVTLNNDNSFSLKNLENGIYH